MKSRTCKARLFIDPIIEAFPARQIRKRIT
jgi:hypothetical protein